MASPAIGTSLITPRVSALGRGRSDDPNHAGSLLAFRGALDVGAKTILAAPDEHAAALTVR